MKPDHASQLLTGGALPAQVACALLSSKLRQKVSKIVIILRTSIRWKAAAVTPLQSANLVGVWAVVLWLFYYAAV